MENAMHPVSSLLTFIHTLTNNFPSLIWSTITAVIALCIATRIVTGYQSRPRRAQNQTSQEVRIAPRWLPWVGHSISFAINPARCIAETRKSMKEPVFGLRIAGTTQILVLSPSMADDALSSLGVGSARLVKHTLGRVFGLINLQPEHMFFSVHGKISGRLMSEPFIFTGPIYTSRLIEHEVPNLVSFCRSVVDQAAWERDSNVIVPMSNDTHVCEADFFALIKNFVGHITTTVFMGQAFVASFPDFISDLWRVHSQYVNLVMGVPRWFPGILAAYAARDRLLSSLATFQHAFALWDDGRDPGVTFRDLEDVSDPIKACMSSMRDIGLNAASSAPELLFLLWSINANISTIVAWNILRIVTDPKLTQTIREEISPYVKAFRQSLQDTGFPIQEAPKLSIDLRGLLISCPLLQASYYETLRLDSAAFSIREVTKDLPLNESDTDAAADGRREPAQYTLRTGDFLLVPHGALHNDARYFPDPATYDPSRFLGTNAQTGQMKAEMRSLRPFGVGTTKCKGQLFAEGTVLAFTAAIFSMWDFQPADGERWIIPDRKQGSAALLPKKDIRVQLRHRV